VGVLRDGFALLFLALFFVVCAIVGFSTDKGEAAGCCAVPAIDRELDQIIRGNAGRRAEAIATRTRIAIDDVPADTIEWGERQWVEWYAGKLEGAKTEFRTPDGSRVDIVTAEYAIECDYAGKWKEGIGQALFYAATTNRKPALLLLLHRDDQADRRDYLRALVVCNKSGIRLITVRINQRAC